ncbi:variant erythrocyte surface antigen-1 family protein [Babesia caballi]|uniref:Variant erythrocyte surface antigen-1 family protein n=1 Tax=Babesia caballi TaxID=5871 RepID=A0AAV4LN43_BABCB|nr:variant erythrocyte surface antigen-1 family protein [Babesia caballi]
MTQGASGKKLTDCPSNLKEAIDWILRVTGKDTVSSGDNNGTAGLAKAVQELLNTAGVTQLKPEITIEQTLIENLAGGLAMFIGYGDNGQIKGTGIAVGQNGQIGKPWENRENATDKTYGGYNKGYIWSYPRGATWRHQWDTPSDSGAQTCAKIFLGCVPMLFYGLGLLYWRCRTNGEWNSLQLNETALYGKELCYYMCSQGFVRSELKGDKKTGSYVVSSALNTFSELNEAVAGSNSLIEYLRNLNSKFNEALKVDSSQIADTLKQHPLSALFLCASAYFTHHRSAKSAKTATSPSTIRHMLYWLSGLTITPQFGDLLKHIDTVVPADFKVAVSGSPKTDETLTADDMMGHLITACLGLGILISRYFMRFLVTRSIYSIRR